MIVLADAFKGAGSLGPAARAGLARVLGCPPAAVEFAPLGDLNDGRHRRRLGAAVAAAFESPGELPGLPVTALGDLFPGARLLPDRAVEMIRVPARLYGVLRQHHIDTWSTLLERTAPEVIDWHGVGPLMISRLFGLLMEHSLVGLVKARQPDRTSADLMALLEYEDLQGTVALRAALGDLATGGHPEPVRRSAQRLLQSNHASPVRDTEVLSEVLSGLLEASGSPRDQLVFGGRELTTFDRPSVADLARRLRVSTERIRQMVRRSRERVRIAGAGAPEPVQRLVTAIRDGLGAVAPIDDIPRVFAEVLPGPLDRTSELLLLWLAGPYRAETLGRGWVGADPDQLRAQTRLALNQDGGARLAVEVRDELAALGVLERHRDAWLAAVGAVMVDDMVVSTHGTAAATIERLLFAVGRPTSIAEVQALAPDALLAEDGLRETLRRDRRFVATGGPGETFELAEWRSASPSPRPARTAGNSRRGAPAQRAGSAPVIGGEYQMRIAIDAGLLAGCRTPRHRGGARRPPRPATGLN